MSTLPAKFLAQSLRHNQEPIYIFELVFNGGKEGTEGVNDVYIGSVDIAEIVNFPYPDRYYPLLDPMSISGISQQVDPIEAVSSIGSLTVNLYDYNYYISDIIKKAYDGGHGARRQLCQVYQLYRGMDWADRAKVRTLFIDSLRQTNQGTTYRLSASDAQKDLKKKFGNVVKTKITANVAATGAVTISASDTSGLLAVDQPIYGLGGFIKLDNEIMQWTANSANQLTVPLSGRAMFGSTMAAHTSGADLSEVIVLRGNPILLALEVMTSSGKAGVNGAWDLLPKHWGIDCQKVDIAEWLSVGQLISGLSSSPSLADGLQFEFVFTKPEECKRFVESEICKFTGCFPRIKEDGSLGLVAYNELANATKENAKYWFTVDNVVRWGDLDYQFSKMVNDIWLNYAEYPKGSGKYVRDAIFVDGISQAKWGETDQVEYTSKGMIDDVMTVSAVYQRLQRIMARFSRPPLALTVEVLPWFPDIMIGDIARVTLPIRDISTGKNLDRAFEVMQVHIDERSGNIQLDVIAQPERAVLWQGGVGEIASVVASPATVSIPVGEMQQLTVRAFDGSGNQIQPSAIVWNSDNPAVATVDASGLVTAVANGTATITVVSGTVSATSVVTVAAANGNTVTSVASYPSSATIEASQTQQMAAEAFDVSGQQVNGKSFSWTSDNTTVATVDASGLVTAVAYGTANITAQETGSLVTSLAVPVTVAPAVVAPYIPPLIADSVFKVGTQLNGTDPRISGSAGGPYTILNGADFAAGSYWFDGDVSLPAGSTCTINGQVWFFSLGAIYLSGTVDGKGRGQVGGTGVASYSQWEPQGYVWYVEWLRGAPYEGGGPSFVGAGGKGGNHRANGYSLGASATGGSSTYNLQPLIQISPTSQDTFGTWTTIAGLPDLLPGAGGGAGSAIDYPYPGGSTGGDGGAGGASLGLMARGISIIEGQVDLSGNDGLAGTRNPSFATSGAGGGGGGSSGSFCGLAQRDSHGLPVMTILQSRVLQTPGKGANTTSYYPWHNGMDGGVGAFYAQVIG